MILFFDFYFFLELFFLFFIYFPAQNDFQRVNQKLFFTHIRYITLYSKLTLILRYSTPLTISIFCGIFCFITKYPFSFFFFFFDSMTKIQIGIHSNHSDQDFVYEIVSSIVYLYLLCSLLICILCIL